MMKKILILLLLLAGGGYYFWQKNQVAPESDHLILYGNVDIRDVVLGFRVSGRVAAMHFEEGDNAQKNEVMAVLDQEPFKEDVALAEAQLASAKAEVKKLESGSRPEEISQAKAQVQAKQATLRNAQYVYARQEELMKKGVASRQEYDQALAARDEARAALESAQETLQLAQAGFREEDILRARAEARAAEVRLAQAKIQLKDTEIQAPANGTVLTRLREPGAIVSQGMPVYTLSLNNPVWIRTYVDEPQLGNVYPGLKALVYTDSRPQQPYQGQVGYISPQAEFTPKNVETTQLRTDLVYRLRIIVDNPDQGLRQGMPVTVKLRKATHTLEATGHEQRE